MSFFFIQLSDPQLGLYASRVPSANGLEYETTNLSKAVAAANRLRPAFMITTGDLMQDRHDDGQLAELRRITAGLKTPMYWAPGNTDVGNTPTPEALSVYRKRFGSDNYSFDFGESHFTVLNSCVAFDPSLVPQEWDRQIQFLSSDLRETRGRGVNHIVAFMHHPLFGKHANEEDGAMAIPGGRRRTMLDLFKAHNVSAVFSGHWHRNNYASDGDMQMVVSGPVGMPLGNDSPGLRVVKVFEDRIEHEYYALDEVPEAVSLDATA